MGDLKILLLITKYQLLNIKHQTLNINYELLHTKYQILGIASLPNRNCNEIWNMKYEGWIFILTQISGTIKYKIWSQTPGPIIMWKAFHFKLQVVYIRMSLLLRNKILIFGYRQKKNRKSWDIRRKKVDGIPWSETLAWLDTGQVLSGVLLRNSWKTIL